MAEFGADLFEKVDDTLKSRKQFCIRLGKTPYIHATYKGKRIFSPKGWTDYPQNWLTFTDARQAVAYQMPVYDLTTKQRLPCTGIGWLCGRDGDGPQIIGGDLDCCVDPEKGTISPWANNFLKQVKPFYAEISPSKCGLRYFLWGRLPDGRDSVFGHGPQDDLSPEARERILVAKPKAREKLAKGEPAFNGLELYETGRHLTLTGIRWDERCYPKEDQTAALSQVLAPFLVEEPKKKTENKKAEGGIGLPQLDIQDVIITNGFTQEGDQLFGSHPTLGSTTGKNLVVNPAKGLWAYMHDGINSGGDAWIWLACECGAIAWERAGAGVLKDRAVLRKTLEYAISKGYVTAEEVGFKPESKEVEGALIREDVLDIEPPKNEDGEEREKFNHSKAADAILEKLPIALGVDDKLYHWHGDVWKSDAEDVIHNTIHVLAGKLYNRYGQLEVISALRHLLASYRVEFDSKPHLLGVQNGVVDLRTGEFRDYTEEDLITDQIPVSYDPKAECPEITKFIEGLTPDVDDRRTLLDIIASGAYRKALVYIAFLIGHGSSGSTKFIELIQAFYGNATTEAIPLNELTKEKFALANLRYARYSFGQEIEEVKQLGTSRIKEISGGDRVSGEVKNKQERSRFRGWTKLVFKGNLIPRFTDSTWGFKRRFVEVILPYKFVPVVDEKEPNQRQEDPDILEKITTSDELSGLLNIVIARLPEIIKKGQIYRKEGSFDAMKRQVDSVLTFFEEFFTYEPGNYSQKNPVGKVYTDFGEWAGLIKGNLVERRQFGKYVRHYCGDRTGIETTINGKTETVYPGLLFNQDKFDEEITRLRGLLKTGNNSSKPDINRIKTGLEKSQCISNTGCTGLKEEIIPIGEEEKNPSFSTKDKSCEVHPVHPVSAVQRPKSTPKTNPVKTQFHPVPEGGVSKLMAGEEHDDPEPDLERVRVAARMEYGANGVVDPGVLSVRLGIRLEPIIAALLELGYQKIKRQNGEVVFKQPTYTPKEVTA